jgi:hypothetical protein
VENDKARILEVLRAEPYNKFGLQGDQKDYVNRQHDSLITDPSLSSFMYNCDDVKGTLQKDGELY